MHEGGVSIWFFIGVALVFNGVLITGSGIYELFYPPAYPVVLFNLHASIWWGAVLLLIGSIYSIRFAPRRQASSQGPEKRKASHV